MFPWIVIFFALTWTDDPRQTEDFLLSCDYNTCGDVPFYLTLSR